MANNNQNQNQNKNQTPVKVNPQNPSEADLAKALGTTVPEIKASQTPPAPAPVANKPAEAAKPETETLLDNLLKTLPEKTQASIMKLPAESRLDIAKDYFSLTHPAESVKHPPHNSYLNHPLDS